MFWCCCPGRRLHRHQLHLASYGCVSFSLIVAGFMFTVFAVFQKDSQIGKIWLAGPVLIVVGAVLCGKVMIDWGPAMERGRDSVDSRFIDEFAFSNLLVSKGAMPIGTAASPAELGHHGSAFRQQQMDSSRLSPSSAGNALSKARSASPSLSNSFCQFAPFDRIIYGPPDRSPSPCKSHPEMADKTTQVDKRECAKCLALKSIIDVRRNKGSGEGERSPKVVGSFVFAELNGARLNNYGTMREDQKEEDRVTDARGEENSKSDRKGGRKKNYSQGECLMMNERSFLI